MPRRNKRPIHAPFTFASKCQTKRRFDGKIQAESAAKYQNVLDANVELSTYRCELCGGWHLTRRPATDASH